MATEAQIRAAAARRAEAQANARQAEASARAAEANARADIAKAEAATRQQQIAAESAKEAARVARAEAARPYQIGASIAALPVGVTAGYVVSKAIEKRHTAFVNALGKQVSSLANVAAPIIAQAGNKKPGKGAMAKLSGVVRAAEGLKLSRAARGPAGLVPAGLLLAEGAFSRFGIAPQIEDPRARAIVEGVGTASVFAATNLIGERMIQNATPKAMLPAKAIATVETARNLVAGAKASAKLAPLTAPASSAATTAASVAGKVLARGLPALAIAMAAYEGVKGYQKGGVKGALIGVADSLTFGAVSAFTPKSTGESPRLSSGRAALARAAAVRSVVSMRSTPLSARVAAVRAGTSNGLVASYTRVQAGKSIRVQGYRRS
jgi:hypothetical protein